MILLQTIVAAHQHHQYPLKLLHDWSMLHRQNTTTTEESVEHTDVDNHDILTIEYVDLMLCFVSQVVNNYNLDRTLE